MLITFILVICLWIAFNAYLKYEYGDDHSDKQLLDRFKADLRECEGFKNIQANNEFEEGDPLNGKTVIDMRDCNRKVTVSESIESHIEFIYMVRCNLFHGRKDLSENKRDEEFVQLAYEWLLPFFEKLLDGNLPEKRRNPSSS